MQEMRRPVVNSILVCQRQMNRMSKPKWPRSTFIPKESETTREPGQLSQVSSAFRFPRYDLAYGTTSPAGTCHSSLGLRAHTINIEGSGRYIAPTTSLSVPLVESLGCSAATGLTSVRVFRRSSLRSRGKAILESAALIGLRLVGLNPRSGLRIHRRFRQRHFLINSQ